MVEPNEPAVSLTKKEGQRCLGCLATPVNYLPYAWKIIFAVTLILLLGGGALMGILARVEDRRFQNDRKEAEPIDPISKDEVPEMNVDQDHQDKGDLFLFQLDGATNIFLNYDNGWRNSDSNDTAWIKPVELVDQQQSAGNAAEAKVTKAEVNFCYPLRLCYRLTFELDTDKSWIWEIIKGRGYLLFQKPSKKWYEHLETFRSFKSKPVQQLADDRFFPICEYSR